MYTCVACTYDHILALQILERPHCEIGTLEIKVSEGKIMVLTTDMFEPFSRCAGCLQSCDGLGVGVRGICS